VVEIVLGQVLGILDEEEVVGLNQRVVVGFYGSGFDFGLHRNFPDLLGKIADCAVDLDCFEIDLIDSQRRFVPHR